jgi:vacuolar-type H+-ATPase subunit C/Vma6
MRRVEEDSYDARDTKTLAPMQTMLYRIYSGEV